jgi:hypothetical protein
MNPNKNKPEKIIINVISFIASLLVAPFMLLFVFGAPLLTIICIYFLFTIGGFEYLVGALLFGIISAVMWEGTKEKITTFIKRKNKSNE